jgi:hypothetical protein
MRAKKYHSALDLPSQANNDLAGFAQTAKQGE